MELTKTQRWMLANQYRILEALHPEDAEHLAKVRTVLERGYSQQYAWLSQHIEDELSTEDCQLVGDVLQMYAVLNDGYAQLTDKSGVDPDDLVFPGFDGNNEAEYIGYARFLVEVDERWRWLRIKRYNSHVPYVRRYRRMLETLATCESSTHLTKEEIQQVIQVGRQ